MRQTAAAAHASVVQLQRGAGNRAVAGLVRSVQRKVGWSDAATQGHAWNVDERAVGTVRRIPLEGLSEGLGMNRKDDRAQRKWVWDDDKKKKGHWTYESTMIADLSPETAKGKAIVLLPDALDATKPIEVVVFLHGFTEDATTRPFAGWRTLVDPPATKSGRLKRYRQGVDANDVAPVRDVALDHAAQQLEESGEKQLVVVLPQGGLHSQFGKEGDQHFAARPYVDQVVAKLRTERRWRDASGKVADVAPAVTRVVMAGHSGAGAALAHMADAAKPSTALSGDLVIYDAINGSQLSSFQAWALKRLDADLAVLKDPSTSDAGKLAYLRTAQKLRGYTTDSYITAYIELDNTINRWFARHKKELGQFAGCLRANYALEYVDVDHEELMRGSAAGAPRAKRTGTILDAIKGLHPAAVASTAACPAMPTPLADRYAAAQKRKKAAK